MKVKFYLTGSGRSPVEDFLQDCSPSNKSDLFDAVTKAQQELSETCKHSGLLFPDTNVQLV